MALAGLLALVAPVTRDPTTAATEWRDGHVWCRLHKTWWKLCPCPGQGSTTALIDHAAIEATTPDRGAFGAALIRLGEAIKERLQ